MLEGTAYAILCSFYHRVTCVVPITLRLTKVFFCMVFFVVVGVMEVVVILIIVLFFSILLWKRDTNDEQTRGLAVAWMVLVLVLSKTLARVLPPNNLTIFLYHYA